MGLEDRTEVTYNYPHKNTSMKMDKKHSFHRSELLYACVSKH